MAQFAPTQSTTTEPPPVPAPATTPSQPLAETPSPLASTQSLGQELDRTVEQRTQRQVEQDQSFKKVVEQVTAQAEDLGFRHARSSYQGNTAEATIAFGDHQEALAKAKNGLIPENAQALDAASAESAKRGAARWTDAVADASKLQVAMTGADDEMKIFELLEKNTSPEKMQALKEAYQERYGKDLIGDLKYNLGGSDRELALKLVEGNKIEVGAAKLLRATRGAGTDEAMIKEVYKGASAEEISQIEAKFNENYSSWSSGWGFTSMGDIDSVVKAELSTADYNEIKGHREKADYKNLKMSPEAVEAAAKIENALSATFNDDEAAALNALRVLTPEQRLQVSEAYKNLNNGASLEARLQGELSVEQFQEARAYLNNDPSAVVLTLKRAVQDADYDLTKELLSEKNSLDVSQEKLRADYTELTGLAIDQSFTQTFNERDADALNSLVVTGKVDDVLALRRAFVGYTSNAEEQTVIDIVKGKTKDEIVDLERRYAERYPGATLRGDITFNLGGREEFLALQALNGEPETVHELRHKLQTQFEYESSGLLSGFGSEYKALKRDLERFEQLAASVERPASTSLNSLSPEQALAFGVHRKIIESNFESYSAQRDLVADRITTGAVIVVCTAVTIATAGTAGVPIWGVALAAGGASFATKVAVKTALRGRSYDTDEMAFDAATSAVEGVAAFTGAAVGAKALQAAATRVASAEAIALGGEAATQGIKMAERAAVVQLARALSDAGTSSVVNAVGTGVISGDVWEQGINAGMQRLAISAASEFISSGALSSGSVGLGKAFSRVDAGEALETAARNTDVSAPRAPVTPGVVQEISPVVAPSGSAPSVAPTAPPPSASAHPDLGKSSSPVIGESAPVSPVASGTSSTTPDLSAATPSNSSLPQSSMTAPVPDTTLPPPRSGVSTNPDPDFIEPVNPGQVRALKLKGVDATPEMAVDATVLGMSAREPRINVISHALELMGKGDTEVMKKLSSMGIKPPEVRAVAAAILKQNGDNLNLASAHRSVFKTLLELDEAIAKAGPETAEALKLQRHVELTKGIHQLMEDSLRGNKSFSESLQRSMVGLSSGDPAVIDPKGIEKYFALREQLGRLASNPQYSALVKATEETLETCQRNLHQAGLVPEDYLKRLSIAQLSGPKNHFKLPDDYLTNAAHPRASGLARDPRNISAAIDSVWRRAETDLVVGAGSESAQKLWIARQERLRFIANDLDVKGAHLDKHYNNIQGSYASQSRSTMLDSLTAPAGTDLATVKREKALEILIGKNESARKEATALGLYKATEGTDTAGRFVVSNDDLSRPEVRDFVGALYERQYQKFTRQVAERVLDGHRPPAAQLRNFDQVRSLLDIPELSDDLKRNLFRRETAQVIISRLRKQETSVPELAALVRQTNTREAVNRALVFSCLDNPASTPQIIEQAKQLGTFRQFPGEIRRQVAELGERYADTMQKNYTYWIPRSDLVRQMENIDAQIVRFERIMAASGLPYQPGNVTARFQEALDRRYAILPEPFMINRVVGAIENQSGQLMSGVSTRASSAYRTGREWVSMVVVPRMNTARRLAALYLAPELRPDSVEPALQS